MITETNLSKHRRRLKNKNKNSIRKNEYWENYFMWIES